MENQSFKNHIGKTHEIVMANVLGVPRNASPKKRIDLINSNVGIEVKGCLVDSMSNDYKKNYVSWSFFGNEVNWHKTYQNISLYGALGTYELSVPREKLGPCDMDILELFVSRRDFWVVPWDWILNFPISRKAKNYLYRYPKPRPAAWSGIPAMPKVERTMEINKGLLHFVEGVNEKHFDL